MAMIICPECGKEISDKATACPNCGCPINNTAAVTLNGAPVTSRNEENNEKNKKRKLEKDSIMSIFAVIFSLIIPISIIGGILGVIDLIKNKYDGKRHIGSAFAIFMCIIILSVQTLITGGEKKREEEQKITEAQATAKSQIEQAEYVSIYDLTDNCSNYKDKIIETTIKIAIFNDYTSIDSSNINGKRIYANLAVENRDIKESKYIKIVGKFDGNDTLNDAVVTEINDSLEEQMEKEEAAHYQKMEKEIEEDAARQAEEQKKAFEEEVKNIRETAETPSYDDLLRYPDSYKEKAICVKIKVVRVEPDGLIFDGEIEGEYQGKSVALYDKRLEKEPKLIDGDTITIYGYGGGVTTVKVQETSGLIPKTIDKYDIPSIYMKDIEFR